MWKIFSYFGVKMCNCFQALRLAPAPTSLNLGLAKSLRIIGSNVTWPFIHQCDTGPALLWNLTFISLYTFFYLTLILIISCSSDHSHVLSVQENDNGAIYVIQSFLVSTLKRKK